MDNTVLDLEAITRRGTATSRGPWYEWMHCDGTYRVYGGGMWGVAEMTNPNPALRKHDMRFIAHAHEDIAALIAEVKRLKQRLENSRKERRMGDTILGTHYEDCWRHEGHHACAVTRVEQLVAKLERLRQERAEIHWVEVKQLRRELRDERVRRDEWEKMYQQAVAGTEVERLRTELAQSCDELNRVRQDAQDQSDEVQALWLSPCEAKGLRRQLAQAVVAQADAELAAHVHDKSCGELAQTVYTERRLRQEAEATVRIHEHALDAQDKVLTTEHQLWQEAEQHAKKDADYIQWLHRTLKDGGYILSTDEDGALAIAISPMQELKREKVAAEQRAERAEALAALVNEETAALLDRLAKFAVGWAPGLNQAAATARKLAACIRETLGETE